MTAEPNCRARRQIASLGLAAPQAWAPKDNFQSGIMFRYYIQIGMLGTVLR